MRKLWITNLISIMIIRYTRFIALLATMFVAVACFQDDLDFGSERIDTESDVITIYGNVARFADCEVSTRANKTPEESYVSKMALAVFTKDGSECIHYELRDGSNLLYTLDRAKIRENHGDKYDDKECVMYIFANMPRLESSWNGTLQDLLDLLVYEKPGLTRPDTGFPMIGSLGDESRDGKEFVLIPMSGNRLELPTVDGIPTDYLNIPMSAIFAKMSFEITVSPDQDVDVHAPARFEMTGYEVHNLPNAVSFNSDNNKEGNHEVTALVEVAISGIAQGGDEGSGSIIEFDFYLPERLVTPATSAEAFTYPLGENGADVIGYSNIPAKHKKYAQRYKPLLLGDGQKATYITIKGKYRDHHEYYHNVEYNIYLGADNYSDFNIVRNNQYYNKLNIKGITSSSDQSSQGGVISIDHRVNVERSSPLIVSLRRETQLDSHFEVRPMRMRISGDVSGATAIVEVLDENGGDENIPTWVRLEKSGSTENHIKSGISKGKRMYFTTNLVTETLAEVGKSVEVRDFEDVANSTVWIYVDEADPAKADTTRTTRSAIIRVTYDDNTLETPDVKDYHISQYNLHKIQGEDNPEPYYIEQYEEYLYNYDSEDSYGQIREEGLPWGLEGKQLSNKHLSFSIDEDNTNWKNYIDTKPKRLFYDFYTFKQDADLMKDAGFANPENTEACHKFAGQAFTKEIAENTNSGIKYLNLSEQANSAVEYCYSRNKRNTDGTVDVKWYLPAADELEDFIVKAYNYYKEFQENFYWTSQPAYRKNIFYYEFKERYALVITRTVDAYSFKVYEDNPDYARATKVNNDLTPVPSGLNMTPEELRTDTPWGGNPNPLGYFYEWIAWKKGVSDDGIESVITKTNESDAVYDEYIERSKKQRYGAYLGHLEDLMQEGYLPREESHRVRCVRKQ